MGNDGEWPARSPTGFQTCLTMIILFGFGRGAHGALRVRRRTLIIMMEMTADRTMILPLLATALIADAVSAMICPHKLYHALSAQFRVQTIPIAAADPGVTTPGP